MQLIELIKEPVFWVISAIGSILLSVLANLVTPYVSSTLAKKFATRKIKTEIKKQELINEVQHVSSNQNLIINYKIDAAYWLLRAVMLMALGTILISFSRYLPFGSLIPVIIASVFIARSNQWLDLAKKMYKIATFAQERNEEEKRI